MALNVQQPRLLPSYATGLISTAIGLAVLATIDTVTPYGWKVFVVAKIFKIAWAVTAALMAAAFVRVWLSAMMYREYPARAHGARTERVGTVAAAATALVLLGYLMPDWNPWSEAIGAAVLLGWVLVGVAASRSPDL